MTANVNTMPSEVQCAYCNRNVFVSEVVIEVRQGHISHFGDFIAEEKSVYCLKCYDMLVG